MSNESKKDKKKFKRPLLHKIVNVFIGLSAGILFLLILFFGFSQTKTFRGFLKDQITEFVSESINGSLHIERLEGSVLSSIILYNTYLVSENDTLFDAQQLVIKTSPIHLLLKRILVRDIVVQNAHIRLREDKNGEWSFSKLTKETEEKKTDEEEIKSTDTTFPFTIQVNNFSLQNLNFIRQTYSNANSNTYYKHLKFDDLRLNGIYLDARLFANLSTSTVRLYLERFSVDPNFQLFNLKKLSGEFEITEHYAQVNNLNLVSDSSNIKISAKVDELNLLGNVQLRDFKDYPLDINFTASALQFSDLYTFIKPIDFLDGKAFINLQAQGYFGDFDVKRLNLDFLNSHLSLNGRVQNLHTPERLFLDVAITDSKIIEAEAFALVKGLDIPLYHDLVLENLNVKFKGEPTRFHAELLGNVNEGNVFLNTYLDLQTAQMDYDIEFQTNKLNLFPIIGFNSSITSKGTLKGYGTDPNLMDASFNVSAYNSVIDSIEIDSTYIISTIQSKLLDIDITSIINDAQAELTGNLDLNNESEPVYDLGGNVKNLRLENFTGEISDSSNLNLAFKANGKNLEIDKIIGDYEIKLEPSYLRDLVLDETSITLSMLIEEEERKINLQSEFADFNINGRFSLEKAIDILIYEGVTISKIITDKIEELNPIYDNSDSLIVLEEQSDIPPIAKEDLEFNFNILFKDFELIALFLNNDELDIVGSGEGTVLNDSLHFEISTDIYIENLLNKKRNDILYLSNVEANLNFSRDNRIVSFNKIFGTISLEGEKIYTGIEINNLQSDFVFNQSKLFFNTSLELEDFLATELEGIVTTGAYEERVNFSNILINYQNIPWTNYDTCTVMFNEDGVQLSNLILNNGSTVINLDGQINNDESHNYFINVENMPGLVLSNYIFDGEAQLLGADINLKFVSTGFLTNPEINLDLNINDISYNKVNFGSLTCVAKHINSSTLFDIDFIDRHLNINTSLLTLDGSIPLNINYVDTKELLTDDSELQISLRSNNFDIGSFGNVFPYIKNQSGTIESKVDIVGTLNDLKYDGIFNLENGRFTSRQNNLDYGFDIKTTFNKQFASVDNLTLYNKGGSKYVGEIKGNGIIGLNKIPFSDIDLSFNGDLALLGKNSKTRNSNVYGDLFIKTDNDWKLKYENNAYSFNGNIIIDRADVIYTSLEENLASQNNRIIYKFLEDSYKVSLSNQKFVKILNETRLNSIELSAVEPTIFNLNTNIIINNIATLDFIISPKLNQILRVETTGQLKFETIGNETKAQGSLSLLNGSQLDFLTKTFDALGTIRFERDLADPHLNIVATYSNEIDNFKNSGKTEEVAVKLKLNTAYSDLQENLSDKNNLLSVYVGRSDIENDIPDQNYDESNALTFIIFNQLNLDLNNEQKSTLADMPENVAFSLLGSQITSFLNSSLISNVQINKYSGRDSYKLLFSGKYNDIRYSFGGSFGSKTDYLQLNNADFKLEYSLNPKFLVRVEQKNPIIETSSEEKVQEIGLKYKFEF